MGRKENEVKKVQVSLKLTPEHKGRLKILAGKKGMNVIDYIFSEALKMHKEEVIEEKIYKVYNKKQDKWYDNKSMRKVLKWIPDKGYELTEEYIDKDGNVMVQGELPNINN